MTTAKKKYLTIRFEEQAESAWALPAQGDLAVYIGRDPQVTLPDDLVLRIPEADVPGGDSVSRMHVRILRRNNTYWVEDLEATNPTLVNGRMVMSFVEVCPPFTLTLGEVCLHVDEEELTQGKFDEKERLGHCVLPAEGALVTRALDTRLRREWPDVHEELRWADALNQVLETVRGTSDPQTAQGRVAEILALTLRANRALALMAVPCDEIGDALRARDIQASANAVDYLASVPSRPCKGEDALCVPLPPEWCIYTRPPLFKGAPKSISMFAVRFADEVPETALEERARRLAGLALTLLESFGAAAVEIERSRTSAREHNPVEPSEDMKALCRKHNYWGEAPRFKNMLYEVERAIAKDFFERSGELSNMLLIGERGVGKTALATIIHALSDHSNGPFFEVNCGAIVETLAEALLFGCREGVGYKTPEIKGYFESAHKGVIFLDEIGRLSLSNQVKLLKVLETGRFLRVGEDAEKKTNCHVIAATNLDLKTLIDKGEFLEDLYDRINTCEIRIPPLRERRDDISLIMDAVVDRLNHDAALLAYLKTPAPKQISRELREILCAYPWPGNARILVKNVDAAFRHAEGLEIGFDDLPERLRGVLAGTTDGQEADGFAVDVTENLDQNTIRMELEYYARLMHQYDGAVGKVVDQAKVSAQTFLNRRTKDFPALVAQMDTQERERLRELAGKHWVDLVKGNPL